MTRCYKPESCIHLNNCSSGDKHTCDSDTDIQLYLLDRFFESLDGRFCKGVTCCPVVPCGELPETMTSTQRVPFWDESTESTESTQNKVDYVVLLGVIPVSLMSLIVFMIVCFKRGRPTQVEDTP